MKNDCVRLSGKLSKEFSGDWAILKIDKIRDISGLERMWLYLVRTPKSNKKKTR